MGLLASLKHWRQRRVIDGTPLTDEAWRACCDGLRFLQMLEQAELARLRELVVLFLDAKEMAGAGGLELSNAIRLSVAVQACLPVLNLGLEYYRGWVGVVIYPGEFVAPRAEHDEDGVVHEYDETISGEAWEGGPVILSWEDASHADTAAEQGYNVVIHEFAHKIDMLNGEPDGVPPLHAGMDSKAWSQAFAQSYAHFCRRVDVFDAACEAAEARAEETGGDAEYPDDLSIDPYASEHPSEFFAVMSEVFFVTPEIVKAEYPAVYAQLAMFYRQDPAARRQAVQS